MKSPNSFSELSFQKHKGFTLIEVMVSLAILGILAGLAAPSFTESIKQYKVNAIKDDLLASMQAARSEAIRRGVPVILIKTTGCAAMTDDDWTCGWQAVVDANPTNDVADAAELAAPLQITSIPSGYNVAHPGRGEQMIFNRWGQAQGVGQRFVVTNINDGSAGSVTTVVCISSGGRTRVAKGATCS